MSVENADMFSACIKVLLDPNLWKEIGKGYNWAKLKRKEDPFSDVPKPLLFNLAVKSVVLLLGDKLTDGPGKGGWGRSDKVFAREIHGEEAALRTEDSVTITVNAMLAIRSFVSLLRKIQSSGLQPLLSQLERIVYQGDYVERRWNSEYGWGGKLSYSSRDGKYYQTECYRHTAMLLRLWLEDERYGIHIPKTYEYLMSHFEKSTSKQESIDTVVLTHEALRAVLNNPQQSKLLDVTKVPVYLKRLEASTASRFATSLRGWTCERDGVEISDYTKCASRQPYSLCVLAEMAASTGCGEDLSHAMQWAMDRTLKGNWANGDGAPGFAKLPGGHRDIALSCLGASALLRKPKKTSDEMKYLRGTIEFVVKHFESNSNVPEGTYLWPTSYFIRDVCDYMRREVV